MARPGEVVLRQRVCRGSDCQALFWICRRCDRGQRYCSSACQVQARRQQCRRANRRHQRSPEGRQDHRDRQQEYRRRRRLARVTDQASASATTPSNMPVWDAGLARITTGVSFSAMLVARRPAPPVLPPRRPEGQPPPFLCCIGCGRRGHFVDPFPTIPKRA